MGHFVSSHREREKSDRNRRGNEREGQGRKRKMNENEEIAEIKLIDCVGVLYCLPEKGRKEIEEIAEEMKERDSEERGK